MFDAAVEERGCSDFIPYPITECTILLQVCKAQLEHQLTTWLCFWKWNAHTMETDIFSALWCLVDGCGVEWGTFLAWKGIPWCWCFSVHKAVTCACGFHVELKVVSPLGGEDCSPMQNANSVLLYLLCWTEMKVLCFSVHSTRFESPSDCYLAIIRLPENTKYVKSHFLLN